MTPEERFQELERLAQICLSGINNNNEQIDHVERQLQEYARQQRQGREDWQEELRQSHQQWQEELRQSRQQWQEGMAELRQIVLSNAKAIEALSSRDG